MTDTKPNHEKSNKPSSFLCERDFNSAGFRSYVDLSVPEDNNLRGHLFAEIAAGLEERGIQYKQLPCFDLRARLFFQSPEDRQVLYDVMMDDDFSFRILKRQEGILLPRPKITPKDENSEATMEQVIVPCTPTGKITPDVS